VRALRGLVAMPKIFPQRDLLCSASVGDRDLVLWSSSPSLNLSISTSTPCVAPLSLFFTHSKKMALSQRANSVLLLCLISSLTYAAPDVPSKLTFASASTCNELSPPDPLITQRATLDHALFARSIATCGYISGNAGPPSPFPLTPYSNLSSYSALPPPQIQTHSPTLTNIHPPAYPLTCPSGYDCVSTMQDRFAWACCNQIQCVSNYQTCADFGAGLCEDNLLGAAECSSIYTSILSCSDTAAPSCFLYARSTGIGDPITRYSWGCGASGSTVLVLATTTGVNGEVAASTSTNCKFSISHPMIRIIHSFGTRPKRPRS